MMITNSWLIWAIVFAGAGFSVWAANSTKWGRYLGFINVSILLGLIIANIGILPENDAIYTTVMTHFVPVGITMMLFMADLSKLKKVGAKMVICMAVCALLFVGASVASALLFNVGEENWIYAAVATSYFTGNFQTAAGNASSLGMSSQMLVIFGCAVTFPWIAYSLLSSMVHKTPLPKFLGSYKDMSSDIKLTAEEQEEAVRAAAEAPRLHVNEVAIVFAVAVAIVGVSSWLSEVTGVYAILFYATFGILVANFTPIKRFVVNDYVATFIFTMYMLTSSLGANYKVFLSLPWQAFANIIAIYVIQAVVYIILLKLMRMPWEYGLLAHMACVGGPISTPPLAKRYGWSDLVLPGIVIAVLGQVCGAYCGVLTGTIVKALGG